MAVSGEQEEEEELHNKPAYAVPLASARQHPENQKENQAGHSSERTVKGQTTGTCVVENSWGSSSRRYKPDSKWYFFF